MFQHKSGNVGLVDLVVFSNSRNASVSPYLPMHIKIQSLQERGERREILSFLDSYLNTTSFWLSRDNLTFVIMMYLVSFKYSMGSFLWVEIIRNQVH